MTRNLMLLPSCILGLPGAAVSPFGLDFGAILGSILGSRTRSPILAKTSTAPWREHDFQGSGGSQKGPNTGPKTARRKPRSEAVLGPFRPSLWALLGAPGRAKMDPGTAPKTGAIFEPFWGLPRGGAGIKVLPPRGANALVFGARGETTEGGTKPQNLGILDTSPW